MTLPDSSSRISPQHPLTNKLRSNINQFNTTVQNYKNYANKLTPPDGSTWSPKDKQHLENAQKTFDLINTESKGLEESINKMNSTLQEMNKAKGDLLDHQKKIQHKINTIDDHIKQYNEKISDLTQKGDLSTEEAAWKAQGEQQLNRLLLEKEKLEALNKESTALYQQLIAEEEALEKKLDGQIIEYKSGKPTPEEIEKTTEMFLSMVKAMVEIITAFTAVAATLLSAVAGVLTQSSTALQSADVVLNQSQSILNQYPPSLNLSNQL